VIGETFAGKYNIVRLVGQGGMGSVYEARHAQTGRRVAVKVIGAEHATDPNLVRRFEIEARATGEIESQHIAQVLDVGVEKGTPFLVMEFLQGEDLDQLLDRLGTMPPETAVRIVSQACLGLDKAHAAKIIHRDIKPANVFLAERDEDERVVKLLDFGVAKIAMDDSRVTVTSTGVTPTPVACTTCLPGSVGRRTPSAATDTSTSSTVTFGASVPFTLMTIAGTRGVSSGSSFCASCTASRNWADAFGGTTSCVILL